MKKRTDRMIAVGGVAASAVLLPGIMVVLAQTGIGTSSHHRKPGATESPAGAELSGGDPVAQPSIPYTPYPSSTKKPKTGGSYPFGSGPATPAPSDPDRDPGSHGKKPHMPKGSKSVRNSYRKADDGAKITAVKKTGTRQYDVSIATPALGKTVKTRVLVPKSWKAGSKRSWPVVYAYHGGENTYTSWTKDSNIESVAAPYDVMVVMPEGGWRGSYTNWWNGGRGGIPAWETFHTSEVVQLMERNFHAGTSRAAIGLSSGGQGSITYAERHPGLFRYAASYSGALNITAPGMPTALMMMNNSPASTPTTSGATPRPTAPTGPRTTRPSTSASSAASGCTSRPATGVRAATTTPTSRPTTRGASESSSRA
ncbi:alpha/beta hydrolase family protein [Actinomadura sp. J1-007]|uniref:alpha/beta hydrolase n=1 Tax=Actinomadura sp. J1-007 TaxID=2661913 RepID=UPI0013685A7B|nr:alpha/beta hydrolase-fold protein [Actinomadura sp. J1-007]